MNGTLRPLGLFAAPCLRPYCIVSAFFSFWVASGVAISMHLEYSDASSPDVSVTIPFYGATVALVYSNAR